MSTSDSTGESPIEQRTVLGVWTELGAELRAVDRHLARARHLMGELFCAMPLARWKESVTIHEAARDGDER